VVEFRSDMTVELVKSSASDEDVVWAARVSTQDRIAEHAMTVQEAEELDKKDKGLINFLMRDRHGTPFEHSYFTFYIEAPIFVWREFMRHRIASYNEESGRYKELKPVFYVPDRDRKLIQTGKPGAYVFEPGTEDQHYNVSTEFASISEAAYGSYQFMLQEGVAREVARMVLPLNIYSSAFVTMNARSLMNFLSLRRKVDGSLFPSFPQREIEMVAEQMELHFSAKMPETHRAFLVNKRVAP
jgi:thymidylate synthase (FAD)